MKYSTVFWFLIIGLILLITYPMGVIISDEYSYLTIGLSLGQHLGFAESNNFHGLNIHHQNYSIGYPLVIAVASLLGAKAAYIGNIILFLLSILLMRNICRKITIHPNWAYAFTVFMPVVFSSRLLMSEMSAMFLVVVFLFAFYSESSFRSFLIMGFACVVSFWFREGTIVLLFPLVAYKVIRNINYTVPSMIGALIGLCPIFLQQSFYSNLELRNTGVSFGFDLFIENLSLALFIGLIVFPLGLVYAYISKITDKKILVFAMGAYTIMQILYQYNGWEITGVKTLISYPRFYVVLAPFFILFYGSTLRKVSAHYLYIGSIVSFLFFSIGMYFIDSQYEKVRLMVYDNVNDNTLHTNGGINEISKIVFPERGQLSLGIVENINENEPQVGDFVLDVRRSDSPIWISNIIPIKGGELVDSVSILGFLDYRLLRLD